ncbi:MAG TPA: winged helix-turn-helix domain-containing protein, partial [Thermoanaerobaculia bacterium]|nr:winged helix-turn-helix domain-containing protein [Thermoanaerobaculia bacterium]
VLRARQLVMDRTARLVSVRGRSLDLSPKEFAVLEQLLLHRDEVLDRAHLGEHAWDRAFDPLSNVIDVTVHRLRKKIAALGEPDLLQTVKGVGYIIRDETA